VWFDQSELRGGDAWDRQIRKQIHDCALFVPVISAHSDARQEGYFRREWRLAVERAGDMAEDAAFLVPVVVDNTKEATARVPDRFREVQWSHAPDGQAPPAFAERIRRLLAPEPSHATTIALESVNPVAATTSAAGVPHSWWSRPALLAAALVVMAGGAYLALDRLVLSKRSAPAATSIADKSIAVLPFADLSEKRDQEYFADGLAEEIVDLLAKIPGLKVVGRTSSFQFKSNGADLRKIGAALGASHIVEGSVRRLGNRVRVTVQLIDAREGTHRWSETYDRDTTDILSLQREIATGVARELQISVADYFGPGSTTKSAEAYDLYLRGIRDVDTYSAEPVLRAIPAFSKAVEYDPAYVNAWIGLATAYDVAGTTGISPAAEAYRQARLAVDKALDLDPSNADAYAIRAFIRMNVWDWDGAEDDIRSSLRLRKTSGATQAAAKLATARGDSSEAERLLRGVLALDPLDTYTIEELASTVYPALGQFEESDRLYSKLRDLDASYTWLNTSQSIVKVLEGNYAVALQLADSETNMEAKETALAIVYSVLRKPDRSQQALERLLRIPSVRQYNIATVYAYRGEKDLAFRYLEAALQQREPNLLYLKTDPLFTGLHSDQRYGALLRKMKLPE
jgi:TolB-like protein/Tfp pilus assembly protein PilF